MGGHQKVDMKTLKQTLSEAGYGTVKTVLNSGNICFESHKSKELITQEITDIIRDVFGVLTQVLVLEGPLFIDIAHKIPPTFVNDSVRKADVLFYLDGFDEANLHDYAFKQGIDSVIYNEHALIHSVLKKHQTHSGLRKIVGTPLYRNVTIRNVNTVRKLCDTLTNCE